VIVIDPKDNRSNQKNVNKKTVGTNKQYDQVQGNRGKQLNPNKDPTIDDANEMDDGDVFWYDGCDD
jgi:hypothetical protein